VPSIYANKNVNKILPKCLAEILARKKMERLKEGRRKPKCSYRSYKTQNKYVPDEERQTRYRSRMFELGGLWSPCSQPLDFVSMDLCFREVK
jgi:hypothetical protein